MALAILTLLLAKHLIADGPCQMFPWQYLNKGTYGHPGGLVHSGIHAAGTFLVLMLFVPLWVATTSALADGIVHYHIDWAKVNVGRHFNLKPDNSEWFWVLLLVDQFAHQLTYIAIVALVAT